MSTWETYYNTCLMYILHIFLLYLKLFIHIFRSHVTISINLKYCVIFLDSFSYFVLVFPIRNKSDVFTKFTQFYAYVQTQFQSMIKSIHWENKRDFDNYFCSLSLRTMKFNYFYAHIPPNKIGDMNACFV